MINTPMLSSTRLAGKIARLPLSLVPRESVVPILRGKLRGRRWIAGSGIYRCWLGFYEQEKQDVISEAVQPNTVFYDVGANVGFYTLLSSILVGAGKVFAFEPLLRNLEYLKRHIALNRIQNVEVLELAIADKNGTSLFEIEPTGSMGCLSSGGQLRVQTASLDSLLAQGKILPPDYIKMDIEGAELLALKGAEQCIRQYRPEIFLATHGPEIHSECCRLLDGWGYDCQILELNEDGLGEVVANPKP